MPDVTVSDEEEKVDSAPENEADESSRPAEPTAETPAQPSEAPSQPTEPAQPAGPKRYWFVVHCYSGYEKKVEKGLKQRIASMGMQDQIFRVIVPTEEEIDVR